MRHALIACALIAAPALVQAGDSLFSYTYADARYVSVNADANTAIFNGSGVQVTGSYGFLDNYFVTGSATRIATDDIATGNGPGHLENYSATLGLGGHYAITPTLDAVGSASYNFGHTVGKEGLHGSTFSGNGVLLEAGLRMAVLDQVQIAGLFDFVDKCGVCNSSFNVEAEYKITPNISALGRLSVADAERDYLFGARYNF